MKILFVIGQLSNGGAERVVTLLANELSKRHKVSVVALIKDEKKYDLTDLAHYYGNSDNDYFKLKRVIKNYSFLSDCCRIEKPDIIIGFTTEINFYCCLYKLFHLTKKIIISERNDPKRDPQSKIKRLIRPVFYLLADKFVFQTNYAANCFSKRILNKSKVIYNPVVNGLPSYEIENCKDVIVTISRLQAQKNIPLLIDAFSVFIKKHNNYILEIYGDGPDKNKIIEYIEKKQLTKRIILKGFCSDVHKNITKSKMFILTSDYEGMSNAMLEALCMGLPSICTDCPAYSAREVISNGSNGFLIQPNDINDLVKKMNILADDFKIRKKFKENSVLLKEHLSIEVIARE